MAKNNVVSIPARPAGIGLRPVNHSLQGEQVVPNGYSLNIQRILMGTSDDLEREIDLRTYESMENDSTIAKSKKILVTGVLADEMQLAPGATEDEVGPDEYAIYVAVMELCQRFVDGLDKPYRDSLGQLLGNAIRYGHGIGEVEWEYRIDGSNTKPAEPKDVPDKRSTKMWERFGLFSKTNKSPDPPTEDPLASRPVLRSQKTRLMPKAIKVKPRDAARFVVDDFMSVIGLIPRHHIIGTNAVFTEIIDRDKFLVLTYNKQDEDPRGKSAYRPAFPWHNVKSQMPIEMLRLVLEEIVPKVVAILPQNAQSFEIERDSDNNVVYEDEAKTTPKMVTAAESVTKLIENFRSGSGVVLPYETKFEPFKKGSTGTDADLAARIIKILNDEMENCILGQTLAQSEGEHQARSASQQVAEILHNIIFGIRWLIAMMTLTDLFEVGVKVNLGEWALRYLPQVSLGDFVRRDWGDDLTKLADAYFKGLLDDTQRPELMAWMNLPRPGPSRQEQTMAQMDTNGEPVPPPRNRPDKNAGVNRNNGNGTEKKNVKQTTAEATGFSIGDSLGHHTRGSGFVSRNISSRGRTKR